MRAIEYTRHGTADVLKLVDREPATPGPGEVLVRIAVSGVNPTDWKSRQGAGDGAALAHPQVPGQDGSGIVEQVGAGVPGLKAGDRVWIWDAAYQRTAGTSQEFAAVPVEQIVELPDGVSFDTGASIGIPALTAHRALTAREAGPARLAPRALTGATVLVAGGAGAVGHAAIQLAVWSGASVIATVSSDEKAALASAAGAKHVINYRTEDIASRVRGLAPSGIDIVVEVDAVANLAMDLDVLALRGTVSLYAASATDQVAIPVRAAMTKNARFQFIMTYSTSDGQKHDAVAAVTAALRDAALGIGEEHGLPIQRFPLERTADAHRAVENGFVGKVLIDVAPL